MTPGAEDSRPCVTPLPGAEAKDKERERRSRRRRSVSPQTYARSIRAHSRRATGSCIFPGQDYTELADWLYLWPQNPQHALGRSIPKDPHCLIVLHTLGIQGSDRTRHLDSDELHALQQLPAPDSKKSGQVLFIRGHLTPDWVKALGAKYRIAPEFFNRHLRFLSPSIPGAIFNRHPLPSSVHNVVRLRISTILHSEDLGAHQRVRNVWEQRRMEESAMQDYFRHFPLQGLCGDSITRAYATLDGGYSLLEQEVSIFLSRTDEGWIAIVWSDIGRDLASSFAGPWLPYSTDETIPFHPFPVVQSHSKMITRQTTVERLVSGPENHPMSGYTDQARVPQTTAPLPFDFDTFLDDDMAKNDALYALTNIFRHSLSSERQVINLLESQIQGEMRLVGGIPRVSQSRSDHPLDKLLCLRDMLNAHTGYIQEGLHTLKSPSEIWTTQDGEKGEFSWKNKLVADYEAVLATALQLDTKCSDNIGIMMNRAVISESNRAIEQAKRMKKLTMLASFFIPLSFTCSLFGMNFREFGQGTLPIWLFAIVTVPIVVLSYLFYAYDMTQLYHIVVREILRVWANHLGHGGGVTA